MTIPSIYTIFTNQDVSREYAAARSQERHCEIQRKSGSGAVASEAGFSELEKLQEDDTCEKV